MRKVVFRADGGPTIGMGHFIRTLALAEMLKDEFYCIYATQSPTEYQITEIESVCNEWHSLPNNETHFNTFLDFLTGDEIVVLDNYYFTTEYQRVIKAKGCKLVCIDDMHDKHYVADVVINHAEGIEKSFFLKEDYTKLYLGYKYAMLRKDYLVDQNIKYTKEYSWFIMMGGTDYNHLTHTLLSYLEPEKQSFPVAVVIGSLYDKEEELHSFSNIKVFKGIKSQNIYQLMTKSQAGILPASTVAIEACAARLPFVCGFFVDNQKEIYNGIRNNNLAVCIDNLLEIDEVKLSSSMDKIGKDETLKKIEYNQVKLLDKMSKKRFINAFQKL